MSATERPWDEDLVETLGLIRDKAENYLASAKMPLPPHIHVEGLKGGMEEIFQMAQAALAKTEVGG